MTTNTLPQRTGWIDYAKGLGIILVVYAHLASSAYNGGIAIHDRFFHLADSIIYSFHMPLFFFLAGLFAAQSYDKRGLQGFVASKLRLLAYPYFIWSFLQVGVELLFSQHSQRGISIYDLLAVPYVPWSQFWFLYALLLMYIGYGVLRTLGRMADVCLVTVAAALFFFPVRTGIMALNGFSTEFMFFVTGIVLRSRMHVLERYAVPGWAVLLLFPVLVGSGYAIFTHLIPPARLIDGSHPFYFLFLSVVGITFCIGLARFLDQRGWLRFVRVLGACSLPIYLVHMLAGVAVRVGLLKILHLRDPFLHLLIGVAAGLIVPVLLYRAGQKTGFPYLFELPAGQRDGGAAA